MKTSNLVTIVCKAVGLAMGVAVIVISVLKAAPVETNVLLLGIGLFALGMAALNKE